MHADVTTSPTVSAPSIPIVPAPAAPFVSVVVPTYREAGNVCELVERISAALQYRYPAYEIIIVDDDSRDGIDAEVARLREQRHPVRLIVRRDQRGLGTAVMRGFDEAVGDILVRMDADLSHPPEKLPELIAAAAAPEADFAIGSRYVPGGGTDSQWSQLRRWNSRVATWMARPFANAHDPLAGFFALPCDVYRRCAKLDPVGYKIGLEILVKAGCRHVREIPIMFADRKRGQSKLTLAEQIRYVRHLKRLADFKYGPLVSLLVFCLVGATGAIVDLASYAGLLAIGLPMPLARAAAILLAITGNYALDRTITFDGLAQRQAWKSYWRFVCGCSLGALLNWTLAVGLPHWLPLFQGHLLAAACVGIVSGTLVNFQLARRWAFCAP